ncbi:MAG: ornithine carbamoyltransferase [Peptococcaceae bacterium]|jgi:ornithine carbamoyltransferase|nr:ornithine carbamoyltransferase [Peptococcaceae bacterium]
MELKKDFVGKDFLALTDFSSEELLYMLDVADYLKAEKKAGRPIDVLKGKTLGMIFEKSSTRTRVSFETGMYYLGGYALFLSGNDSQIGRGEPIPDTARVLSRYLNGIMIRTFAHERVEELARYASIPVINGLTDLLHPCQVMADAQTIREHKGRLKGLKFAFIGDGNNMAHSLMNMGAKFGMEVAIACPSTHMPDKAIVDLAQQVAKENGGSVEICVDNIAAAAKNADILCTDAWTSMGQEEEKLQRQKDFAGYQINADLLKQAKDDALVMHCLPAYRGQEITEDVFEGPQSVIFDEAENRLYAQMAVMALTMLDK